MQVAQPRMVPLPLIDMTGEAALEEGLAPHSNSNSVQAQQDAWHAQHSSPTQSENSQNSGVSTPGAPATSRVDANHECFCIAGGSVSRPEATIVNKIGRAHV